MAVNAQNADKNIVKKIAHASGWMQFKVKRELSNAQQLGIDANQYLKRRCWELDANDLKALGERLEHQRQIREEHASQLSSITGWSMEESASRIREAKKDGITFKQYLKNKAYDLSSDELPRLALALKANKRRRRDYCNYMVDMVVDKSGWTRTFAIERLEDAKQRGINLYNYFFNSCWSMNDGELDDCSKMCKEFHDRSQDKREKCMNYILEQTEWNEGEAVLKTLEAAVDSGCSVEDYARCHMWDMSKEQQRTFLNSAIFRKFRIANNDFQIGSPIFDYKDVFEEVFSDLISRRHFLFDDMTKGEFFDKIKGLSHIVVKPVRGSYGRDIEILRCNESYLLNGELYQHLVDLGRPVVIEEKIQQCDALNELCPTSVNTLRVVTLRSGDDAHVLQCVLRCGVGAIVDNIHSGGLVIEVDPETGICRGDAIDYFGNVVKNHPITKVRFKGLQIPNIGEVITLAKEASKVVPECGLIGWDIAVTESGADLVEGNLKADYDAGQMAHLGVVREGLRETMVAPYVNSSVLGHSYLDDLKEEAADAALIDSSRFKFSVVMPVYNAQDYLHDVMKSLLDQTIGFEGNIQVVLVNDGSPDGSAEICKEYASQYPDNVVFVDKENGGPSSARNAGIPYAEGAFINFLDPDDKWAKDAFEKVWSLIDSHKGEIDVVGCRQRYFEAKSGYHQLDYKFKDGDCVVDIRDCPDYVQLSATSAFVARSSFRTHSFDERISLGDDSKLLTEVILDKKRYGLCRSALHHFRKREDASSITQNKAKSKKAYVDTMRHYYSFLADYSKEKFGRVVPYVQHCLVNGLKYRVNKTLPEVLTDEEANKYREEVLGLIRGLADGTLLEARNANPSLKLYMMHLKSGVPMTEIAQIKEGDVWVNGGRAFTLTGNGDIRLQSMVMDDDSCLIKGIARIPGFVDSFGIFSKIADDVSEISFTDGSGEEKKGITGEVISTNMPFVFELPDSECDFDVRMFASYNDEVVAIPMSISKGGFFPRVGKGEAIVGDYSVSRPSKFIISLRRISEK